MSATLTIDNPSPDELDRLIELESACFEPGIRYPRWFLRRLVYGRHSLTRVARFHRTIVGFVSTVIHPGGRVATITTIEVDPAYRRRGIARALIADTERRLCARGISYIKLEVAPTNRAARELYYSAGYQEYDVVTDYYRTPHHGSTDALVMVKLVRERESDASYLMGRDG